MEAWRNLSKAAVVAVDLGEPHQARGTVALELSKLNRSRS